MATTYEEAVLKLVQRYNSGKSLNAADGNHFHIENALPGTVSEDSASNFTKHNAKTEAAIARAEEEKERQRTTSFLERQRKNNLRDQNGEVREKVDYSVMHSEVNLESAQKSTLSIAAAVSRCSKLILELDDKTNAANTIPYIETEDCNDFRSSIQTLVSLRTIATAAVQRAAPTKKPAQEKREFFVREVADHLRSTTKATTWLEWELDKNFDIFCNQVRDFETKQCSMRWLECEDRAWGHAKEVMEEHRASSGALSFTQARAILVDDFGISLQNDALVNMLKSSQNGNISKVQQMNATYRRLAGPANGSKSKKKMKENPQYRTKQQQHPGPEVDVEGATLHVDEQSDEQLAELALQRNVNQAWKRRFAEMMETLDAKDLAKRRREKSIFVQQYMQKAQAVYNLGSNKFTSVLRAHSPALADRGCTGHLRRLWNNLMVSGTVLNQLIKDCEYFCLTYYCKKIQKQWRTVRIRRFFEAVVSRSKYLSTLTQKAKLWKTETGFSHSITGRSQMRDFRTAMKGQRAAGLMEWDREFAHASTLTNDLASVQTLRNRIMELKSRKKLESMSKSSAGSDVFNERHPQAAKWSFQSQYYELLSSCTLRIQRFWRSTCKRRAFFVSIRYAAAFCILRWMLHKIKGQVGKASGGLHGMHITANYAKEAAHLAHLIYEKNSLRYQLEGTTLIQNRRKYLDNDLRIMKTIQDYQSSARLRSARDAIAASDELRLAAIQETVKADKKMNHMIQVETIRVMPRPKIPLECVSHPVGPEADSRHVFLLPNKIAARQHKEYQRSLYKWDKLQAATEGQEGLPMEQKLASTALAMQLRVKTRLVTESRDRLFENGAE